MKKAVGERIDTLAVGEYSSNNIILSSLFGYIFFCSIFVFFSLCVILFKPVLGGTTTNRTHSDSATLPLWWVDERTGLGNQDYHAQYYGAS